VPILVSFCPVRSVVDVGCGVGAWAQAFLANGFPDVIGVDGDYIADCQLLMPPHLFQRHDLSKPLRLNRTWPFVSKLPSIFQSPVPPH
jgi:trans-aconitate methyltransferase